MTSAAAVFDSLFIASPVGAQTLTANVPTISALSLEYAQLVTVYRLLCHQTTANNRVDLYAAIATATTVVQQLNATLNNLIFTLTPLATDNFHRPNEEPLDPARWTVNTAGMGDLGIISDVCLGLGNGGNGGNEFYTGVAFPHDQFATATIGKMDATAGIIGEIHVHVRTPLSLTPVYEFTVYGDGHGGAIVELFFEGSTSVSFALPAPPPQPGDTITIIAVGDTAVGLYNGVQLASITGLPLVLGFPGLGVFDAATVTDTAVSAFTAGSATALDPFAGLTADKAFVLAQMRQIAASALQTLRNVQSDE